MDKNEITEASNYQAHFQKLYFTFISTVCSHKAITEKMENSYHHLLQASTFRGKKKTKPMLSTEKNVSSLCHLGFLWIINCSCR